MEKDIEASFKKAAAKIGGIAVKFTSQHMRGMPDRFVLLPKGILIFAEIKDNKDLDPAQLIRKKQLEKLGFKVYVIRNRLDIDKFILDYVAK